MTTKYGATATQDVDRVAAPVPTVTAISTVTVATAGEVTLTGTNLTGLKKVVVKNAAGKLFNGTKFTVTNATSANVTLPALPRRRLHGLGHRHLGDRVDGEDRSRSPARLPLRP